MIDTFSSTLDITSLYTSVSQQHRWKTWHTIFEEKENREWLLNLALKLKKLFVWVLSKQFARLRFFFFFSAVLFGSFCAFKAIRKKNTTAFFLALQYFSTQAVHCRKRGKLIPRTRGNVTSTGWRHGHPAAARFSFFFVYFNFDANYVQWHAG